MTYQLTVFSWQVGRVELDFLVESGLGFGFLLGLGQMITWVLLPKPWTLPVSRYFFGWPRSDFPDSLIYK